MVSGHATATVNGTVIADATEWEVVDGNIYFPPASLKQEFFTTTDQHTTCPFKGLASYYTIDIGGQCAPAAPCASAILALAAAANA